MPLHDTANVLAKPQHDATAVARRKASLLKKQRQLRRELRTLQDQSAKDLALLEKERQELRDGRLNAAASHAAKKGLAQKPRSSRDRAEFDARTLKVEAPRAEQAAKRAEARCSLALKRLAVAREKVESLPGNLGRGPDQIDQIRRQREAARLSEEKIKLKEEAGRVREAAKLDHALRRLRSEARDLRDDADAEDDRVSRARGAAAAAFERALPARRRVASLQLELRDQCDQLTEDGPLAVADALFDGERVEGGSGDGISSKACARLLALVWLDAPDLTDPEELPEAPLDAGGDFVALYGPPPPPPSSAARAGALAFDLADDVYDRDAFRAVFVKAAAAGPLPWPDQAFQRMPPPRSPSPSPPSSPVDDVSPPASPVAAPPPASPARAKTPKSARPPSSRQKTPQGSPEAAAPPSPEEAPPSPEAQVPPSPEAEPEFAVGQRVEANFENEGEWFAGVVDKVEDGRYDITYDDGDEEFGVGAARVRAATGDADVLAPLPAPQDELRRSDEYEESFEEEN